MLNIAKLKIEKSPISGYSRNQAPNRGYLLGVTPMDIATFLQKFQSQSSSATYFKTIHVRI
jgi:hypothetical protein